MKVDPVIPLEETTRVSSRYGNSINGLYSRVLRYLITIFIMLILLMIVMRANASTGRDKPRKSTCRQKAVSCTYLVIVKKKNNPFVYNNPCKKSRSRCIGKKG